jgi:hypothetical protein
MEVMDLLGMNALIFHQNDLTDQVVFPEKYYTEELMWKRNPVRMHTIFNNRHYIAKVIRALRRRGMDFYVEVKEICFPENLPELYPRVLRDGGGFCPFDPFWGEFLRAKYEELFRVLPDLAGVIVSAGTRESKISISTNTCECPECRGKSPADWYGFLLAAMYEPIRAAGKTLVVRDFSYSSKNQRAMIDAAGSVSKEIVISLKYTPHDYYPPFPNNPSIGNCGGHREWVEFDGWGQFFGLGFCPCSIVEDLKKRLVRCAGKGVDGVWMRTDWEVITEASISNSFNMVNLFAIGILGKDPEADTDGIYRAWAEYGLLSPLKSGSIPQTPVRPSAPDAWRRLKEFMIASWRVVEKSQYVRGHLFNEDDQYCNSVKRSFDMMVHIHGRDDWEPGASRVLEPTPENIAAILEEKRRAVEEVRGLENILSPEELGLPGEFVEECRTLLALYILYTRGFEACAGGVFSAVLYKKTGAGEDRRRLEAAVEGLETFDGEIAAALDGTDYPHYVYWLLDRKRVRELVDDLKNHLSGELS